MNKSKLFLNLSRIFLLLVVVVPIVRYFIGEQFIPAKYIVYTFLICLFGFSFLFLPPKVNRENLSGWILFISIIAVYICFSGIIIFPEIFNNTYVILFLPIGILTVIFSAMATGNHNDVADKKTIKNNVIVAISEVSKKLNLDLKQNEVGSAIIIESSGVYKNNAIFIKVKYHYRSAGSPRTKLMTIDESIISIKRDIDNIEDIFIAVFQGETEIETENQDKKNIVAEFIKEKQLDFFDFTLRIINNNEIYINVPCAIEELSLWEDYIELGNKILAQ